MVEALGRVLACVWLEKVCRVAVVGAIVVGLLGAACVVMTLLSAVQTVVVPRATPVRITRLVFVSMSGLIQTFARGGDYQRQDRVRALYAPLSLLALPAVWLTLVLAGYTAMFWAVGADWRDAFLRSGSAIFTLGFDPPPTLASAVLVFSESALGLGLLALLIAFLPSIYSSYSERELMVTSLEHEAGSPPSAAELLERLARIGGLEELEWFWQDWTRWFAHIEETHTSTPSLVHFRSPQPDRSWVTAAGAVLDTAALVASTVDVSRQPAAELCIRAGYVALQRIGSFFGMPYDADPSPTDPISIDRSEYDTVCQRILEAGAPLKPDRDQAWRDFAGWRVNYDAVLLRFASLCRAPSAPWSADRAIPFEPVAFPRRRIR